MSTGNLRTFNVPHVTGQTFRRTAYIWSSASALSSAGVSAAVQFAKDGANILRFASSPGVGEGSITIAQVAADTTHPYQYLSFELAASAALANALTDECRGFFTVTWANGDIVSYFKLQIDIATL